MWKSFFKDYFSFTRRDRNGILVLLAMIAVVAILPYCLPNKKPFLLSTEELVALKELTAGPRHSDSIVDVRNKDETATPEKRGPAASLFYFDPNELDASGWLRLGIKAKTVSTIIHYRDKGGRFKSAEDLQHVYGFKQDDYDRLSRWVRIANKPPRDSPKTSERFYHSTQPPPRMEMAGPRKPPERVDINMADSTALIALPGIGRGFASRIIRFRERLGGFYSVKQVGETYGLPDSTFQLIEPMLRCSSSGLRQINLNSAGQDELRQHPYIRWALANAILQYRAQHGNFSDLNDLLDVHLMDSAQLAKLKPYLTIQ